MGLSHVVAAAILYSGVAFVGLTLAKEIFDHDSDVDIAWTEARDLEREMAQSGLTIDAVSASGGVVTLNVTNSGSRTLHLNEVTVLFDGTPQVVTSSNVNNQATAIWPAAVGAQLNVTAASPASVYLATEHGIFAVWRV